MLLFLTMVMKFVAYSIYIIISVSFVECSKIILFDKCAFIVITNVARVVNSRGNKLGIRIRVRCT